MLREVDAPVQIRFNPNVTLERKPLPSLLCVSEEVASGLIQKADTVSAAWARVAVTGNGPEMMEKHGQAGKVLGRAVPVQPGREQLSPGTPAAPPAALPTGWASQTG